MTFFIETRSGRRLLVSSVWYSAVVSFRPTSIVSRWPDLGCAFSVASTAASGFFSASSSALVVARMKRLTRSALAVSVSLFATMPELIRFTP